MLFQPPKTRVSLDSNLGTSSKPISAMMAFHAGELSAPAPRTCEGTARASWSCRAGSYLCHGDVTVTLMLI